MAYRVKQTASLQGATERSASIRGVGSISAEEVFNYVKSDLLWVLISAVLAMGGGFLLGQVIRI